MGMGATNTLERMMASVGKLGAAPTQFKAALDIPNGGVLFAIPALLANGLLLHTNKFFELPRGYYSIHSVFILLGLMALCRIKQPEQLRYCPPGEWGKLLGLDRIPEVRTLRDKLSILSKKGQVQAWSGQLCEDWMTANPQAAGALYVDGHVRVYHGDKTKLPLHYVAREKLCLRATTDYWVNAMDGQPFFVVNQPVDAGLLQTLRNEIVPRLLKDVPGQPSLEQLDSDPLLHRFILIFDREAYSPVFFAEMKKQRIACLTYHKYPGEPWPQEEFSEYNVQSHNGNCVVMKLAERGVMLSNGLWVREVRKLSEHDHQTSVLATDYKSDTVCTGSQMFARWSQENFFRYMRQHYNLDRLVDYETRALPDTTRVVNPQYRKLDGQLRSTTSILNRRLVKFGAMSLTEYIEPSEVERFEQTKADLQQEVVELQDKVSTLKAERDKVQHHITAAQLPQNDRFKVLSYEAKHFVDTIKMIAYRAETAMTNILQETMSRSCDVRSQLRDIYRNEADLIPDYQAKTLTVRLHHLSNHAADQATVGLCEELNSTDTVFPGTNLRLIYQIGPSQNP